MAHKWLSEYYGSDMKILNPVVLLDGKNHAVVRLQKRGTEGLSSVGYVLVKKGGHHNSSASIPLGEGVLTSEMVASFSKKLSEADSK